VRPTRRAVLGAPLLLAVPRVARAAAPTDTYAALLAEEHAAIHLYGILGPRLPESLRDAARAAYDDHRRHRDLLTDAIRAAGGTPAPSRATYALPLPVDTAAHARTLATTIEDSLALRWHEALRTAAPADRGHVAGAFGDECVHLATYRWSATHRTAAASPPFPGR
jgi:hypothetical protein